MSATMELSKLEQALACARDTLRSQIVFPTVEAISGAVAEVDIRSAGQVVIEHYEDADAYVRREPSHLHPLGGKPPGNTSIGTAQLGVWLFGPSRVNTPSHVYRLLSSRVDKGHKAIIATETPWQGKLLTPQEYGEYTTEETCAMLIRTGFERIDEVISGPFFSLWEAYRSEDETYQILIDAEIALDKGDWASAEQGLASIEQQLKTAEMVREYALLVAACHDLAGRVPQCLDALTCALDLDPQCARAMCGLARIAALKGDLESADQFFSSALKHQPALVAGCHGLAVVKEAQGKLDDAFLMMMTASDLRPKDDGLMMETVRIGNAAGKGTEVSRFLEHRIGGKSHTPSIQNILPQKQSAVAAQ
ncbi:MAG: hypothetical protein QNJ97_01205 [Myxococcota bacterium]|nr:hypothetical protein [Myxococcota bacterium]